MASMADRLLDAMARSAAQGYGGEAVSELEHALQCAELAEAAGADEELVLACLLHDVGRYAVPQGQVSDTTEPAPTTDEPDAARPRRGHHEVGADLIAPWVPERVAWCVRRHADAKRYLCATDRGYHDRLSQTSRRTLVMQGGPMTPSEVAALGTHPWLGEALALRRWDDQAKVPGKLTRSLQSYAPLLRRYFDRRAAPR